MPFETKSSAIFSHKKTNNSPFPVVQSSNSNTITNNTNSEESLKNKTKENSLLLTNLSNESDNSINPFIIISNASSTETISNKKL